MSSVRVRYAPSPTGYLHLGGVRTALYGWLWARRHSGSFVLRIEDTDLERNTAQGEQVLLEALRWLGLDWDEGPGVGGVHAPYRQSERLALYRDFADKLVERGWAYRCYATKEELEAARSAHEARRSGEPFNHRVWRDRHDWPQDQRYVIRFKAPLAGSTGFTDLVKGPIEIAHRTLHDAVLLRGNGMPLFTFAGFVDDLTMKISLVARGDDHVINTPMQILLYRAMGCEPPAFAHLPLILAPDGEKLSKRHAAVNVLEYRDQGFLPDAVLNYLARLGWSHGDQEIFARQELIDHFDWGHVGTTAARYDRKKFLHVQASQLRALTETELAERVVGFLAERGLSVGKDDPRLLAALPSAKPRASTLEDLAEALDFYFRHPVSFDAAARAQHLVAASSSLLRGLRAAIEAAQPFERTALEQQAKAWLEAEGFKLKHVAQAARVALTGRSRSPGLFEVMEILGRDLTLARLDAGARIAAKEA